MQSRVILPTPPLRAYVHHYWVMKADRISAEMNIVPTGSMKWMFHRSTPLVVNGVVDTTNVASVCGQYNRSIHVHTTASTHLLFVFFQPYAMKMITGIPSSNFEEDNVSMDLLGMPEFHDLKCRVLDSATDEEAIAIIENFIIQRIYINGNDSVYLKQLATVCDAIANDPTIGIDRLSDIACLSERQFRRIFTEHVGLTPKQMLRTKRFLQASRLIQTLDEKVFTSIVDDLGFTDHSHFNKEFRHFAGMSPTEYLAHLRDIQRTDFIRGYRAYHE
ncbi:MAG: helix-turn-helix domain-containing protein [Muribaculaceae bacterium]